MLKLYTLFSFLAFLISHGKSYKNTGNYSAFVGATLIDGSGGAPIQNSVLLLNYGRVVATGSQQKVKIPAGSNVIDVKGKTIMPGIINSHGHVGEVKGIDNGYYSQENIIDNLSVYARYGVTTVVSLGNDKKAAVALRAVNDSSATGRARLYIAGDIITGNTEAEAYAVIDHNVQMGVDFIKIRIDDQLGTAVKMPENLYRAVIKRSHELGYKVAAHMYYLEDAEKLIDAGADILAHSIRDMTVDSKTIQSIKKREVAYCPTLTRELSTFVYEDTAAFFSDPFFTREYNSEVIRPLLDPARQLQVRNSKAAQIYKKQLAVAYTNLKKLQDNGVFIIFGTDSGVATRFIGYFEHLELEMMQEAGLTPMQIIISATKNAAEKFGLKELGSLVPGHRADFLILNADPLKDIKNARAISSVYIGGEEVKR